MIPSKGHQFLELDYKSLEVMVAATYHKDPTMLKYLTDPKSDMHRDMAQQIFKIPKFKKKNKTHGIIRSATKNGFVFPEFYGDYYKNCAISLTSSKWLNLPQKGKWHKSQGIKFEDSYIAKHLIKKGVGSFEAFEKHLQRIETDFWKNRFPVYANWKDEVWSKYQKNGYFTNHTGFIFTGVMNKKDVTNYPVQSSAFHILLWSFYYLNKALKREGLKSRIVGQVHDSILIDLKPKELDRVIKIAQCVMENDVRQHWKWINVPLKIEAEISKVDGSLAEMEELFI